MSEIGKRQRFNRDNHDGDRRNQKRRVDNRSEKNEKNDNGELVSYRILCPDHVMGSVIGKNGKIINSIRQDTRAKVKVVDPFPAAKHRVITIYCYVKQKKDVDEDGDFHSIQPLCGAQDALLKVHEAICNALASATESEKKQKDKDECQILVPSSQVANIIGKSGVIIKKLRSKTRTNIKVTAKDASEPSHSVAMDFDNFVLISGESKAVKRALFAVSSIMYKFSPKEEVPLVTSVPEAPPSIIIPSEMSIYPPGALYPSVDPILASRSIPPIFGGAHVPELQGHEDAMSPWPVYSSNLPVIPRDHSPSQSEELILRVLCSFDKIGRVIGKGGATVKSIRQSTGARVEVNDSKVDRHECLITVISTESPDDLKSMAVETVLLLQAKINEDDDTARMRLLVPSKVIGCIIGKAGSIVNEIRKRTKAEVHISKSLKPKCADANDELVEVVGEVSSVRDALVQIVLRLRDDVLKDKHSGCNASAGANPLYSSGTGLSVPVPSLLPSVPHIAPLSYDQRVETRSGLGMLSSSGLHGYGSLLAGENSYASMSSYSSSKLHGGLPPPSSLEIFVPVNAVAKVLGKGGANIANIRKISGAMIEISDARSARGDRIAIISGTQEQKRAAENLIQAFILAT